MSESLPDKCPFCGANYHGEGKTDEWEWVQYKCLTEFENGEWLQDDECRIAQLEATLTARESELAEAQRQAKHYLNACQKTEFELQEILGKALGFSRYCDMPPINPNNPEDAAEQAKDTHVFVGEHVAATLAEMIVKELAAAKQRVAELEKEVKRVTRNCEDNLNGKREQERLKKLYLKQLREACGITRIPGKEDDDGEMH